jgi:carboxymethylenebutenolidase
VRPEPALRPLADRCGIKDIATNSGGRDARRNDNPTRREAMDFVERAQGLIPPSEWSRRGFVMTSLATGFALSVQPVAAQTVITTDTEGLEAGEVKIDAKDIQMPAYRAMPATGEGFPTVLVIHEIWGVHEHIKDVCRRLAKAGYFAVAPELYARQGNPAEMKDNQEIVQKIVMRVPTAQVMSDLDATVAFAKASGKADAAKLGVTGFCWGGWATWMYAAHQPALKAAVSWYGSDRKPNEIIPKNPADIAAELKCPVLSLYGGADQSLPMEIVEKRQAACKAAGKICEYHVYPEMPHAFHADYRPSYRAEAAKDGWARMLAWFKKYGVA